MTLMRPDPTFYPSPSMAMQAPPERLAYVALLNAGKNGKRDVSTLSSRASGHPGYTSWIRSQIPSNPRS
jgi:selenium-binding protein 1